MFRDSKSDLHLSRPRQFYSFNVKCNVFPFLFIQIFLNKKIILKMIMCINLGYYFRSLRFTFLLPKIDLFGEIGLIHTLMNHFCLHNYVFCCWQPQIRQFQLEFGQNLNPRVPFRGLDKPLLPKIIIGFEVITDLVKLLIG